MLHTLTHSLFCLTAGVLLQTTSCLTVTTIEPPDDAGNSTTPSSSITVRFVNQSTKVVSVQFYVLAELPEDILLSAVPTTLFADANKVIAGIGVAGSGLITAAGSDSITLECDSAGAIGTLGGDFLDDEGQSVGTGQQLLIILDQQYGCGDSITFIYGSGGAYDTTYIVQ